ncbi:MAG: uncharacterized protein KVP18_002546 [Porospora cf. gigantea A]|uniref:uncharacterized protein n=1 Tax=Porospora cf. gigantea A TaxID=2853593 RepID=UPI00355A9035|nr:MAG: hypothetical protein KVP18_002546 [Porospora cf. gigantea A]
MPLCGGNKLSKKEALAIEARRAVLQEMMDRENKTLVERRKQWEDENAAKEEQLRAIQKLPDELNAEIGKIKDEVRTIVDDIDANNGDVHERGKELGFQAFLTSYGSRRHPEVEASIRETDAKIAELVERTQALQEHVKQMEQDTARMKTKLNQMDLEEEVVLEFTTESADPLRLESNLKEEDVGKPEDASTIAEPLTETLTET